MNAKSFHLSVQGASHIKKNKECQDAAISYYDEDCAIAIVCDGHGGDDYMRSAYGSQFGVKVAEENIRNFIKNIKADELKQNNKVLIKQLEASIINDWNEAIYTHYEENPFTEAELAAISDKAKKKYLEDKRIESAYGTTMIAVGMTKEFWIGIQIGDGKCVAVNPEGKFLQPIPWDNKCFLNATTSICDSHALDNFRHFYSERLPIAVFVGTDGIDDCFKNDEQLNNLYKTVLYSFMTTEFNEAINDLHDYLPRLSAKGSGDDVSVAVMIDFDRISDIDEVREFDKEKEKAKVEELRKAEAQKAEEERRRVELEHGINSTPNGEETENKPAEKVVCAACGAIIDDDATHCGDCGAKVETETTTDTTVVAEAIDTAEVIEGEETIISEAEETTAYDEECIVVTKPDIPNSEENTEVIITDSPVVDNSVDITTEEVVVEEPVVTESVEATPIEDVVVDDETSQG